MVMDAKAPEHAWLRQSVFATVPPQEIGFTSLYGDVSRKGCCHGALEVTVGVSITDCIYSVQSAAM